jgi:bifunctional non-homologous end joining protein LigD
MKRDVQISHPDKELFPGITKRDLAHYYEQVGRIMVRHVRDRPVAMQAFPLGIRGDGHYMKDRPRHFPEWIPDVQVAKRGGSLRHILIRDTPTLVYLAGQNVITPHVWLSRADDVREPDRIVFDLDPSTQKFAEVRAAARATGELLRELGLAPHAMTTGSRGIHVTVPIKRVPFEQAFAFAKEVAVRLADEHPKKLTTEFHKAKRGDRIFVDVLRNRYAQHAVPPYAVRPRPEAPVAAPLHWDELDDSKLKPDRWTIASMPKRLEDGDAWHGISGRARSVSAALGRLSKGV